jgi:cytochrome c556
MSRKPALVALFLAVACLQLASGAGADDVVNLRQRNFHILSDNMRDIVKGLGDGLPVAAMRAMASKAQAALLRVPDLLPPGSDIGKTNALPLIWSEPERFRAVYDAAARRMAELVTAASQSDRVAFGAAAGRMAAACGDCHAEFRKIPFAAIEK